jgi:hypothetical protein
MADFQFTDLTYWDIRNALPSFPAEVISFGFYDYPLDPFGADALALTFLEAQMANFPPLFLRPTNGLPERLLTADGGLQVDVIDCAAASAGVKLFETVTSAGGGSVEVFKAFEGTITFGKVGGTVNFMGSAHVATNFEVHDGGTALLKGHTTLGLSIADNFTVAASLLGNLVLKASAGHEISCTSGQIKIYTTTSGDVWLSSAAVLKLDAATNIVATATAGSMSFTANTTGVVRAGAAADLTLGARGVDVTLNQAGQTSLTGFAGTVTSLVGALNDLRGDVGDATPSALCGEAGGITLGDVVCLKHNGAAVRLYKCDNTDVTLNKAVGVALNSAILNASCRYATGGNAIINSITNVPADQEGKYLFLATGGGVVLTAPTTGTTVVVGVLSKSGIAGVSEMIFQPMIPMTSTP